jgi:predicted RNA-binding protein YlqC (UPF0109 family)
MKMVRSFVVLVLVAIVSIYGTMHFKEEKNDMFGVYTPVSMEAVVVKDSEGNKKSDISLQLDKADVEYMSGNKSKSVNELKKVINHIREQQSEDLVSLLPKNIEGWNIRTEVIDDGFQEVFPSNQAVASKEFVSGDKLIKISIIIGSDYNNKIYELAILNDGSGGVGEYNGYITKFYRTPKNNKLVIAVGKDAVVTIEGFRLSHTGAKKIADSVNLPEILSYSNK